MNCNIGASQALRRVILGLTFLGVGEASPLWAFEARYSPMQFSETASLMEKLVDPVASAVKETDIPFPINVPMHQFAFSNRAQLENETAKAISKTLDPWDNFYSELGQLKSKKAAEYHAQKEKKCGFLLDQKNQSAPFPRDQVGCIPWLVLDYKFKNNIITKEDVSENNSLDRKKPLRIRSVSDWKGLSGRGFSDVYANLTIDSPAEMDRILGYVREVGFQCGLAESYSSLMFRAESFLPNDSVFKWVEEIYPYAFACLEPHHESFERAHLRVGLLRLLQGQKLKAKQSLLLATRAIDPKEEPRTLFWLGQLETEENPSKSTDYWKSLNEKYPISIHSILSEHMLGNDPFLKFSSSKSVELARRDASAWTGFSLAAFTFEMLLIKSQSSDSKEVFAAQQALDQWSGFVLRHVDPLDPRGHLFLAQCFNKIGFFRGSIQTLSAFFRKTKFQQINLEVMNLYFPKNYSDVILSEAREVDPVLLFALIRQESAFDPAAQSGANAKGLMQLLPGTAKKYLSGRNWNLFNPQDNIRAGVLHLQDLMKAYRGQFEHVLAAYNAGGSNLKKWKNRFPDSNLLLFVDLIPFKETRNYVAIILRNAYWYGRLTVNQNDSTALTMKQKSTTAKWKSKTVHSLLTDSWKKNPGVGPSEIFKPILGNGAPLTKEGFKESREIEIVVPGSSPLGLSPFSGDDKKGTIGIPPVVDSKVTSKDI
jgi:soluble lytic murein transglycosylase